MIETYAAKDLSLAREFQTESTAAIGCLERKGERESDYYR